MAVFGVPQLDIGIAGANTLTTTAQYRPVYISAAQTYSIHDTTATTAAVGVCASEMDSNSTTINVARAGKFKVIMGMSVTAGQLLYAAGNTTGAYAMTAAMATTATAICFGQALESGSTGTVLECWLFGAPSVF